VEQAVVETFKTLIGVGIAYVCWDANNTKKKLFLLLAGAIIVNITITTT
jgi:hypothetical protein